MAIKCALIYGADSGSFSSKSAQHMKSLLPNLEVTELADAQHHLFLDQPVTFMECLSKQLDAWK
jgi:pimeloyl-ACP methyl ester carboxylesterase